MVVVYGPLEAKEAHILLMVINTENSINKRSKQEPLYLVAVSLIPNTASKSV